MANDGAMKTRELRQYRARATRVAGNCLIATRRIKDLPLVRFGKHCNKALLALDGDGEEQT